MRYLVTGASGFIGSTLIPEILNRGGQVVALCRNLDSLKLLKEKYPTIEIVICDIAKDELNITGDIDGIFHFAGYKFVDGSEKNTTTAIDTNIIGTMNVLKFTLKSTLSFIIGASTDKAAQVSGVYGATKFLMEKLFEEYARKNRRTKYKTIRISNIIGSTGSIVCRWRNCIMKNEHITVTDLNATRFFSTLDNVIVSIFDSIDAEYKPCIKSIKMENLLYALIKKYSDGKFDKIDIIGLQPGENLHEKLNETSSNEIIPYTFDEIMKMI